MNTKRILSTVLLVICVMTVFGQAKKPSLMVIPSDAWCNAHGYITQYDNQGTMENVPDYKKAVSTDMELNAVISKINNLLGDRGFTAKDLQQTLKSMNNNNAELALMTSKTTGASISVSPLDMLRRQAKSDIILELEWSVIKQGPKSKVSYNLKGLDAYTNKQIAGATGIGKESFAADVPVLLAEAVQDNMDEFLERLQNHFDDMFENGREVVLEMHVFNDAGYDFEEEFNGEELTEIIDKWLSDNCVNHRFNRAEATETMLIYDQVRMPLYNENGQATDTRAFARGLEKYLKAKYNITLKVVQQGLGKCVLNFGGK